MEDDAPENSRRNLVLTSWAFIIFCAAGGNVSDSQIQLLVINAIFDRGYIVVAGAWLLLTWYLFRYDQRHRKEASLTLRSFASFGNKHHFNWQIKWEKKIFGDPDQHKPVRFSGHWYAPKASCQPIISRQPEQLGDAMDKQLYLYHLTWWRLFIGYINTQPHFYDYVGPYLWCAAALIFGHLRLWGFI